MRTILLLLFIGISISGFPQSDTIVPGKTDSGFLQHQADSSINLVKDREQKEWEKRNVAGLKLLMEQQNEYKSREKKRALIRIGIGVLFLGILITGLLRKRKKTVS